ncbi:hypothetical protein UFOVP928_12 [uncultured Caudovirales phage]|uniref:Uncharacterized protein n=1 Tax=uncultured Caudovirales phage TaxID=2100421 RepID=A0A6J5PNX6_9CAUD|nr:hypothetical protein UFOVP578_38 [uncultured Caudovirales phage]CAB4171676.1 hypothetical protein UFOVP928_12 [uncultured Caudovirales phage]CAB4183735.1 hypothetical protein UFOVP1098_4 [uncultured Caudovirales phage]CAB4200258.1 hypothetical protein UFOVP1353_29 [uncultured Caudovirales phage]CAB4214507.1 hypothetical protein UFOVP1458_41 [uncultured Caudovirales phage]
MVARKPAIQMTNGVDDIIKGAGRLLERTVDNIGRVKIKTNKLVRQDLKGLKGAEKKLKMDMYLGSKKGTYGNPYSGKLLPKKITKKVMK